MPTLLKDLTITEVSVVDAPANPGARILLMKRETAAALTDTLGELRRALVALIAAPAAKQSRMIDEIVEALRAYVALSTAHSAPVVTAKAQPEPDRFLDLAKGLVRGEASTLTKGAVYAELKKRANAGRREGESDHAAFARFAETTPEGRALMQAHRLASGADVESDAPVAPVRTSPPNTVGMTELRALAQAEMERDPKLTKEAALARVMTTTEGTKAYRRHKSEMMQKIAAHAHGA